MNKNPPSYPEPGPTGPYPAYPQHHGTGPNAAYPGYPPPPGGQPVHQGYPQYGWQNVPPQPGMVYTGAPKKHSLRCRRSQKGGHWRYMLDSMLDCPLLQLPLGYVDLKSHNYMEIPHVPDFLAV